MDPEGGLVGYRDSAVSWLLQGSQREPILLSTEPLEQRFVRQQRFHFGWLVSFGLALIVAQLVLFQYHRRKFFGEIAEATVTGMRHLITTDSDGDHHDRYRVTAKLPWGDSLTDDLRAIDFEYLREGNKVAVIHTDQQSPVFGSQPTLHVFQVILILVELGFIVVVYLRGLWRAVPWWATQIVNKGAGRLDSKTGLDESAK